MKLYVITANTYHYDCWGEEISLFGVCDNENDLKKILKNL